MSHALCPECGRIAARRSLLGRVILARQLELGVTQSALTRRCGMTPGAFSSALNEDRQMRPATLAKLTHGLGLSVEELDARRQRVLAEADSTRAELADAPKTPKPLSPATPVGKNPPPL